MSRSRKKPHFKDKGHMKDLYWKAIRREWKQDLNYKNIDVTFLFAEDFLHEIQLRKPKEIINDYDYRDWSFYIQLDHENDPLRYWDEEKLESYKRK